MREFQIGFKFEGGLADGHSIDASDGVTFHEAARQLVALHAHFFAVGDVPNGGALNRTRFYHVLERAPRAGSVEFFLIVKLLALTAAISASQRFAERTADLLFDEFFVESIRRLIRGRPRAAHQPVWSRREPVLEATTGNHEPIVDLEPEDFQRSERFAARCTPPLIGCLRPVGRSANTLTIRAGSAEPVLIDVEGLHQVQTTWEAYREQQITRAVRELRSSQAPRSYL